MEPGQTPDFDEYTVVLHGMLQVAHRDGVLTVHAGEAVITRRGEWVQYSTPDRDGADYVAVCLPAFSPDTVHRDDALPGPQQHPVEDGMGRSMLPGVVEGEVEPPPLDPPVALFGRETLVSGCRGQGRHMVDSIHRNSVRRGLVAQPEDWQWSSARWYAGIRPLRIEIDNTLPPKLDWVRSWLGQRTKVLFRRTSGGCLAAPTPFAKPQGVSCEAVPYDRLFDDHRPLITIH